MKKKWLAGLLGLALLLGGSIGIVRAAGGFTSQKTFTLTISPALAISTASSLPNAMVGIAYSITFTATGGYAPYTWSLASGSTLPAGLSLSSSGTLSGTPTAATPSGTPASFTIVVTDGSGNVASIKVGK